MSAQKSEFSLGWKVLLASAVSSEALVTGAVECAFSAQDIFTKGPALLGGGVHRG